MYHAGEGGPATIAELVENEGGGPRETTFTQAWRLTCAALGSPAPALSGEFGEPISCHFEPWYCCAGLTGGRRAGF